MQQNVKRLRSINVISSEMKWSREIFQQRMLMGMEDFSISLRYSRNDEKIQKIFKKIS